MSGSSTITIAKRIAVVADKYKIHWGAASR